jgi:hypothetical protein
VTRVVRHHSPVGQPLVAGGGRPRRLRRVALAVALAAGVGWTAPVAAQRSVTVIGPTDNPLRDGIPLFTIVATGFTPADMPLRFTLQVSTNVTFATGLIADTTVFGSSTSQ